MLKKLSPKQAEDISVFFEVRQGSKINSPIRGNKKHRNMWVKVL
jgi:hypothetical protein